MPRMRGLYPAIEPTATHRLAITDLHELHVEECGTPGGEPVLFLHGGPGSGCSADHRRYFDPARYHIVLVDQRGAGRSTPSGELQGNTTSELVSDLETVREHLGLERWVLFGGSWGATLALAYAQAHAGRVSGLILRGTFLGTRPEVQWLFRDGANRVFPDYWEEFAALLEPAELADPVSAYHRLITSGDEETRLRAAGAWSSWTARVATYTLVDAGSGGAGDVQATLARSRIESHYAVNGYFLDEGQLLREADRLASVPTRIVHGRHDLTCLLESSWRLHRALPHSHLHIVPDAGRLAGEPAMIDALITASDALLR